MCLQCLPGFIFILNWFVIDIRIEVLILEVKMTFFIRCMPFEFTISGKIDILSENKNYETIN